MNCRTEFIDEEQVRLPNAVISIRQGQRLLAFSEVEPVVIPKLPQDYIHLIILQLAKHLGLLVVVIYISLG